MTGRSPTIIEQQESDLGEPRGVRVRRPGTADELGQGDGAGHLEGILSVPAAARAEAQ